MNKGKLKDWRVSPHCHPRLKTAALGFFVSCTQNRPRICEYTLYSSFDIKAVHSNNLERYVRIAVPGSIWPAHEYLNRFFRTAIHVICVKRDNTSFPYQRLKQSCGQSRALTWSSSPRRGNLHVPLGFLDPFEITNHVKPNQLSCWQIWTRRLVDMLIYQDTLPEITPLLGYIKSVIFLAALCVNLFLHQNRQDIPVSGLWLM